MGWGEGSTEGKAVFDEESVAGWELTRHGSRETYRKRLANGVTVCARWDDEERRGVVEARVDLAGSGRVLTADREEFRDRDACWSAARLAADVAANLPDSGETDELIAVLAKRFGVTEDYLLTYTDGSAVIVAGEPAVGTLLGRADELREAIAPRWWPGLQQRPGEKWVVLSRRG